MPQTPVPAPVPAPLPVPPAAARTGLAAWPARRWATALVAGVLFVLVVGIPTDLIDTPVFGRQIPPTWWAWPALLVSAVLSGLLAATYVARPAADVSAGGGAEPDDQKPRRGGYVGGVLTFFAVGCPVCNKIVLLALGSAGAVTWFEPVQPFLQLLAIGLLAWALRQRVRNEAACRVPERAAS